jgi:DNA-binding transcriptional ArsR family regulator
VQARLLLDLLIRAAGTGAPCPSNFALMDALDLASPDGVRRHMAALRAGGFIALESSGQRRRVTILATGARTDWSRAGGHARAGAAYSDGWGNGSDAILLRLAAEGLDLATMAARLGRTASSVRHRLRRLRAAGAVRDTASETASDMRAPPVQVSAGPARDPGPMRRDIVTTDPDRPADETAQIAAFLAAGKGRKVPPAYVGEVRGGDPLCGLAPISPLARRVLLVVDDTPRTAAELAFRARVDPLLMPEILHDLREADVIVQIRPRSRRGPDAGAFRYTRGPEAGGMILALGLETARPPRPRRNVVPAPAPHREARP